MGTIVRLTLSGRMVASAVPSAYLNVATWVTAVWPAEGTSNIVQPTRKAITGTRTASPNTTRSVRTLRRRQRRPPPLPAPPAPGVRGPFGPPGPPAEGRPGRSASATPAPFAGG
jgi:hypothetical protein